MALTYMPPFFSTQLNQNQNKNHIVAFRKVKRHRRLLDPSSISLLLLVDFIAAHRVLTDYRLNFSTASVRCPRSSLQFIVSFSPSLLLLFTMQSMCLYSVTSILDAVFFNNKSETDWFFKNECGY